MNTYKKKLIEVAIPLEAINAASAREKSIRHGHPSTLHLWWARRPLAACRAVLFAQLVDDPSEYVDELMADKKLKAKAEKSLKEKLAARKLRKEEGASLPGDAHAPTLEECAIEIERQRLFKIIEDLVIWENSTNEEVLERARAEIRRCCGGELPPVYDPFSGGGSIPLEAQRLGLPAYGSDLNPVAVMIGKAMIEIPPKFKDMPPIHPGTKEKLSYRNAEGLAEDVKYYGEWMRQKAWERIGHLYPQVDLPKEHGGGKATVIAWIWARTVPSPDPAFSAARAPLISSFLLNDATGAEAWLEPQIDAPNQMITYSIMRGGRADQIEKAKQGTKAARGANFRCLYSGAAITPDHIKSAAASGQLSASLIAIIAEGHGERHYLPPIAQHEEIAKSAEPSWRPDQSISADRRAFTPPDYGMPTFGDLFTSRQLVGINTLSETLEELREEIRKDASKSVLLPNSTEAQDYARSVALYLAFAIDRVSDAGSTIATWASGGFIRFTFSRQALQITWDYAECNPFSSSTGNFRGAVEWVWKALSMFCPRAIGSIGQSDAQRAPIGDKHVVSTDPPYYDNIGYADLSDYFYVWLRRNAKEIYPDLTSTISVPKMEELIAAPHRHGGKRAAEAFFLSGMTLAIRNLSIAAAGNYPATIYYAFKQAEIEREGIASTGWATFLQAVLSAGLAVVGTWPIRTERPSRMRSVGSNALANSVVLVCRKKDAAAGSIGRAEFIRALKRELPSAIAELQAANIAPADMPQSAIGPGMGIFSRYEAVLESDDSPMSVKAALQLINKELDEYLGGIQGEFDADTRFAITWFEQNGYTAGDYGVANNIAQARGISVESVKHAGIVESAAGKVRIKTRDELDEDWDPATDQHLTVWECCQHLIHKLETAGEHEAAVLLKRIGPAKVDAAKDLAYCLYDICSNKRKDAKEATSYNALIAVWSDLARQAAALPDAPGAAQIELNI